MSSLSALAETLNGGGGSIMCLLKNLLINLRKIAISHGVSIGDIQFSDTEHQWCRRH